MIQFITLYLDPALEILSLGFSLIGTLVIVCYALISLHTLWKTHSFTRSRQTVGEGILLGLDYIVAGDVIRAIIVPNYYTLGILAGLVVIRTILSYFLNKELHS